MPKTRNCLRHLNESSIDEEVFMKKNLLIGLGAISLGFASLLGVSVFNSTVDSDAKPVEATGEIGNTTYTVSCWGVYDHGQLKWGDDPDVYFYYEYKDGSTKTAPAWPGIKMENVYGNFQNCYCSFTPEDEVATFRFNCGDPDKGQTKNIEFFTDRHTETTIADTPSQMTLFNCTIDYKENDETITYKGKTFQPWSNQLTLPVSTGNYYLNVDVHSMKEWFAPEGETNILLNGHAVYRKNTDTEAHRYINIKENSTVNLYDNSEEKHTYSYSSYRSGFHTPIIDSTYNEEHASQGFVFTGGYICNASAINGTGIDYENMGAGVANAGTFNMYGGTFIDCFGPVGGGAVYNLGTFNMYAGRLTGNYSQHGAGLFNAGTATIMKDASIDDNYGSYSGGGIYNCGQLILDNATITNNAAADDAGGIFSGRGNTMETSKQKGLLTLKGKVVVSGNVVGSDPNNLRLLSDEDLDFDSWEFVIVKSYLTIDGDTLDEGSSIGISMGEPGDFSIDFSKAKARANKDFFFSDNPNYSVYRNVETNQLALIEGEAPEDPAHEHNLTYTADGATITATCSAEECDLENNQATLTLQAPANLVYDGSAKAATLEDGYDTSVFPSPSIKYYQGTTEVTSCVNVGTYTAKVTIEGATASVEFSITKADPEVEEVSSREAIYNQNLSEVELPDGWSWNAPSDKVGNVGNRSHKATFTPTDTANYNTVQQDVTVVVAKATEYTVPTGLTALVDKTLSTVTLPTGWAWDDPNQNVGSELIEKVFKATFTPTDTDNYNIVEHVDVTVRITEHEHNWGYTATGMNITASCSTANCPVTEGLTLTLQAPTGDIHYDGNAKVATLKEGYSSEAFPNPEIKYFKDETEVSECVNVGKYTAKVTYGNAVAMVEFEILGKTVVDPTQSAASVEIDDAVVPENITLRVEVRTDVAEKEIAEDYAKIQAKLESNEQIFKVYDVKLIQTIGGVEKEIQPSDIQEGLKITVKMAIPEGIDMSNVRILHIHNVNDMEFVTNYKVEGNELVFEIDRLSQFAFVQVVEANAFPGWAVALIVIGGLLLVCCLFFLILFLFFAKYAVDYYNRKVVRVIFVKKHFNMVLLLTTKFKFMRRNEVDVYDNREDAEKALEEALKQ